MIKKHVLFIINPISGGKNKRGFEKKALEYLNQDLFSADFVFSKETHHAENLAKEGLISGCDYIIAVGGDGTINEVAKVLVGTQIPLGIIPEGSGNGLARTLNIPKDLRSAISLINKQRVSAIDSGCINDIPFFNMAGMGFDALISSRFAQEDFRGPLGYMKTVLSEISHYKPLNYIISIDGQVYDREAFMVSIANSPQYGNDAYISPEASVRDGLLDVCIVKPFHWVLFPKMIYHLFSKTADKTEYVEIIQGKHIQIERSRLEEVHVDGEPLQLERDLNITVLPNSLQVIC